MGFLESFESLIVEVNSVFWGVVLLVLIVGVGLLLTVRLGGIQVRRLPLAVVRLTRSVGQHEHGREGDISPFQALSTALSGTMGIGNIAGVSTAIVLGGPGAIFWMWMTAAIGMATKYAEAVLALKYRTRSADGTIAGGPMYYIEKGLAEWMTPVLGAARKRQRSAPAPEPVAGGPEGRGPAALARRLARGLALTFAFCGVVATIGAAGMPQANSIAHGITSQLGLDWMAAVPVLGEVSVASALIGLALVAAVGLVIVGGIKRIGRVAVWIIPVMSLLYVGGGLLVLLFDYDRVPGAIALIFQHALSPYAVAGGAIGYTIADAIRFGVARGVFTNEAGLGSAPVAYAASRARSPVDQGLLAMLEVFIDTIVTCSITAFVVLSSGLWDDGLTGTALTIEAFSDALGPAGAAIVLFSTIMFGYSTIIGWSYYGEQFAAYILGQRCRGGFKALYLGSVLLGAVLGVGLVWEIADLFNGLMALPNLIALAALSGVVALETRKYFEKGVKVEAGPPREDRETTR